MQRDLEAPLSILLDLVVGVVLMWVYAAILPRFGASLGTAPDWRAGSWRAC